MTTTPAFAIGDRVKVRDDALDRLDAGFARYVKDRPGTVCRLPTSPAFSEGWLSSSTSRGRAQRCGGSGSLSANWSA